MLKSMGASDGRFAPSPSGPLHLGNLRTALLAWLFARSGGGRFLVRIEDLDPDRSKRVHEEGQLADLVALGLDWDGKPVRQSERGGLYSAALERLEAMGRVYPCWCTRAEIQAASQAPHGPLPEAVYPGTCRGLTEAERADRERARPPALRLDAGGDQVRFSDRLHGEREGEVDDFVLRRGDGVASYNLAIVVDDADQGIGEIVRGDDLLPTTPRHVLLGRLLDLPEPQYAHVPLVLGRDGARLAKRHGAVRLSGHEGGGPTPAEALSWMGASLGLAEPGEPVTPAVLLERFDPDRIPREPTVWPSGGRLSSMG